MQYISLEKFNKILDKYIDREINKLKTPSCESAVMDKAIAYKDDLLYLRETESDIDEIQRETELTILSLVGFAPISLTERDEDWAYIKAYMSTLDDNGYERVFDLLIAGLDKIIAANKNSDDQEMLLSYDESSSEIMRV